MRNLPPLLFCAFAVGCAPGCGSRNQPDGGTMLQPLFHPAADFDFAFQETPAFDAEYETGAFSRTFNVTSREVGVYLYEGVWSSRLSFQSPKSTGVLAYRFPTPWVLSAEAESAQAWSQERTEIECPGTREPAVVAADRIDGADGGMLTFSALSLPMLRDGAVALPESIARPFDVRWISVGREKGEWAKGVAGESVDLEFVPFVGGAVSVSPGERKSITINGVGYTALVHAAVIDPAGSCLATKFILYRDGVLAEMRDGGN